MILNELTEILKILDNNEHKRLEKFLRSEFFNTNQSVYKLLKKLKKFHPDYSNRRLTNEYLFRQVYGKRKFEIKTFRYIISELLRLTKQFISVSKTMDDKHEMSQQFIYKMIYGKQFGQAGSEIRKLEKEIDKNFIIGTTYLRNKTDVCLLWHMYAYFSSTGFRQIHKNLEGGEYEVITTIINLCHIYQNLAAVKYSYNIEYEDNVLFSFIRNFDYKGMLNEVEVLKTQDTNRERLLNVFKIYLCFMITFLDERDEIYFRKMRELVNKYQDILKTEELRDIHVMLTNCCRIKRRSIDNEKYLIYSFEIIKNALTRNLYLSQGQYMVFTTYFFILNTALALNELKWAESFVNKYVNAISPEIRDDVQNYSEAEILFRKKKFEAVLGLLSKVKYKYTLIKSEVRSLTLMAYYELNLIDEAFSLVDSYSHFISSNKKLTPEQKEADSNFIFFTKSILKQKEKNEILTGLKEAISKCLNLRRKEWLLKKIEELETKN